MTGKKSLSRVSITLFLIFLIISPNFYITPIFADDKTNVDVPDLNEGIVISDQVVATLNQIEKSANGGSVSSFNSSYNNKVQVVSEVGGEVRDVENNTVGKKIEDEPRYETFFTFVGKENNNFIVRFYHDATEALPTWIEGDIDYSLTTSIANPLEEVNLSVPLIDGKIPKFKLHIGKDSDVFEFGITIINVQSYPTVGGNWTVEFTAIGIANLTITAVNDTEFGRDLEFLELRCGNNILTVELTNGVVFVKNYSCDETGYEISKVLTSGKHTLEFRFGDDVKYANNLASYGTGYVNPSSNQVLKGIGWASPINAYTDNAVFADASGIRVNASSYYGFLFNGSATIPADATIVGIQVRIDGKCSSGTGTNIIWVEVSNDNATTWSKTDYATGDLSTSESTTIKGSPTDLWGLPWDSTTARNIRVNVTGGATSTTRIMYLDWIAVNITYTDTAPPQWSLPAVNVTKPHRGEGVNISALWWDAIGGMNKAWLSTNESGIWRNYTDGTYESPKSLSGTDPLTVNFSWMNDTGEPRIIGWIIYANDTLKNENGTNLPAGYYQGNFTLWGWSNITWSDPHSGDSFDVSSIIQLVAFVNDTNNTGSGPIQNYPVKFYRENPTSSTLLGTSLTNSTGHAVWNWDTSGIDAGTYYPKSNITNNGTLFYNASQFYQANTTVILSALPTTNLVNTSLSFSISGLQSKYGTGIRKPIFAMSLSGMISKIQSLLKLRSLSFSLQSALFKSATSLKLSAGSFSLASLSSNLKGYLKSITSSFSLSSLSGKLSSFYKALSLSINMRSISGRFSSIYKSLAASLTVNQFAGKVLVVTKQLSQSFNLSGAVTKTSSFVKGIQQGLQLSSFITRFNLLSKSITGTINLQSLSLRASTLYKSLSQSFSLQTLTQKIYTSTRSVVSSLSLSDVRARLISSIRPISQNITFQSISARIFSTTKILSQSFNLTSITAKFISFSKSISTSFGLNSITGKFSTFLKTTASALQLNTISGKLVTLVKSLSGYLNIQSSSSKFIGFYKSLAASISLQSISGRFAIVFKSLQQNFSLNAITGRIPAFFKGITQSLRLTSITGKFVSILRTITASASLQAISGKFSILYKSLQQSITANVISVRITSVFRSITSNISLSSTSSKFFILLKIIQQSFSLNSITGRIGSIYKSVQQSFSTNAITGKAISFFRGISQSLQLNSVTARLLSAIRVPTQSLSLSLSTIRNQLLNARVFSSFSLSGLAGGIRTVGMQTSDRLASLTISLTGNATRVLNSIRLSLSSLSMNFTIGKFLTLPKSIQQSLQLSSLSTKILSIIKTSQLSLSASGAMARMMNFLKVSTSSFSMTSASSKLSTWLKATQQSFGLNAVTGKIISFTKTIQLNLQLQTISAKIMSNLRFTASSLSFSGLVTKTQTFVKYLSQSLSMSSIAGRLFGIQRTIAVSFNLQATSSRFLAISKSISQSLQLNSLTGKLLSVIRTSSQSLSVSLAAIRSQLFLTKIFSSFNLSSLAAGIKATGPQTFERIASLAVSITGNMTRILEIFKTSVSSFSLSSVASRFPIRLRTLQQAIGLNTVTGKIISFTKTIQLNLQLQTISTKLISTIRSSKASLQLSSMTTRFISIVRSSTVSLQLSQMTTKLISTMRSSRAGVSFSGLVIRTQTFTKSLTQTLSLSSITARLSIIQKAIAASINLQGISTKFRTSYKSLQQSFSLNAITGKTISIFKGITQSLQLSSVTARMLSLIRTSSQSLSVSLAAIRSQLFTARVLSSFSLSDFSTGMFAIGEQTYNRAVSLVLSVTGNMTKILTSIRTLTQTINVRIITGKFTSFFRFIALRFNFLFSLFQQKTVSPPFSSNTVYAQANVSETINVTGITNSTIEFLSNETIGNTQINTTLYSTSPVSNITEIPLKYLNLTFSQNLNQTNLKWAIIKIYYTDEELSALSLEENSLLMYKYNANTQTWTKLATSLSYVYGTGVNTSGKYVWANVTSFSLYGVGGLKANGKYCSENTECYSGLCCSGVCQSACPTGITPSGGAAGGGGGAAFNITTLPTVNVEFSKMPILREVAPGQSIVTGIIVKNKGNSTLSGLNIEVSGIPQEWVTITPKSLDLDPSQTGGFSIGISVPGVVAFGDYKVVITLKNEIAEDRSFFILRVKSITPQDDKPFVIRIVEIDKSEGKTNVELDVSNPTEVWNYADVVEYVPKELANSTDLIEFKTTPSEIIQKDPIISWRIFNLTANDTRRIYYSASNVLEEFTSYIYWPLKELSLVKTKPISGLEIVDLKIPTLYSGRSSTATLAIRNLDNSSHRFGFELKMPNDWKAEPRNISEVIMGNETKDFKFSIVVPEKTTPGNYIVRGEFLWDDSMIVKEYGVRVAQFIYLFFVILIFIIIIVIIAIVLAYMHAKKMEIERRKYEERKERERVRHLMKRLQRIRRKVGRSYRETE
jgi:hypothetical protein